MNHIVSIEKMVDNRVGSIMKSKSPILRSSALNRIREALEGKKILITGASGFVGRSLLRRLSKLNQDIGLNCFIMAQYRTMAVCEESQIINQHLTATIGQPLNLRHSPNIIFHCVTPASAKLNIDDPRDMLETNIGAMDWILNDPKLIRNCPTVVFTSSGAVYGPQPAGMELIPEHWEGAPSSLSPGIAYAEGKRVAEFLLSEAGRQGLVVPVIARLFTFSGLGIPLDKHFAIGNFVRDAVFGSEIVVRGDGTTVRSYLDSDDMATWLLTSTAVPASTHALHIGSAQSTSIFELASLVAEVFESIVGTGRDVRILGEDTKYDGAARYVPDNQLTKQHLHVAEWTGLRISIEKMINDAIKVSIS